MDNNILRKRTITVIIITLLMMIAEIFYGIITNPMSLTADGIHMGTHVLAFIITLVACIYGIKHPDKSEKMNALGGYTSAIILGFTAFAIIGESLGRFYHPLDINFSEAIFIAVIGLIVNLVCIFIIGENNHVHNHKCHHSCHCVSEHHDSDENLNFKAAYFHILSDILTSVMAIAALILGKYFGLVFLDPVIGIFGGVIIARWTVDLLKTSSKILLE
jgi:cation diffusion facilitator family transporter